MEGIEQQPVSKVVPQSETRPAMTLQSGPHEKEEDLTDPEAHKELFDGLRAGGIEIIN